MVGQDIVSRAGAILSRLGWKSPPMVVTNRTVLELHGQPLLKSLQDSFGSPNLIRIGDGERFKNNQTLMRIYREMFRAHADRRSWIIAFGGGVVGDVAGFAAATFMRGIPFVMVPTTLLAQIDSSVGGKVAINVPQGKNLVGAFHQPSAVLSDTGILKTLSKQEHASGLYEIIKHAAIRSERLMRYLETRLPAILKCRPPEMTHIVTESVRIKAGVVARDEKEENLRMVLNFGHTVGHALEAATEYKRFKHGESVAWGMIAAAGLSRELGSLKADESERLIHLIHRVGPLPPLKNIRFPKLWQVMFRDKKFRAGKIHMVVLPRIGDAEICRDIDPVILRRFLKRFLDSGGAHASVRSTP